MRKISHTFIIATLLVAALAACSPEYDWRDYRSQEAPYAVLFPGKPASQTRNIELDGMQVNMTMTAAEVNGVMFAVGSAQAPDAAQAVKAATAMKTALIHNIDATVTKEQSNVSGAQTVLDVEAKGARNGEPMLLIGRFIAKDKRIYQVVIMGKEKNIVPDNTDTFLSSFKLN